MKFVQPIELHISADLQPAITLARNNIVDKVKCSWCLSLSFFGDIIKSDLMIRHLGTPIIEIC
jgi:hypothetical protein